MANEITLTKRICVASDGYQFLTSGFPNRSKNKKTFDSVDGLFVKKPLLDDLRATESDMEGDPRGRQGIQVDFTIYPNSIREYEINNPGGFKYYSSDPESNSRGIIVFRVSMDSFTVWDRLPPNNPNACCDDNGVCSRLVVDGFYVMDNCNGITYNILDGTIFEGGEGYRLYPYNYTYDGNALRITTYY